MSIVGQTYLAKRFGKCSKPDPQTCRRHRTEFNEWNNLRIESAEKQFDDPKAKLRQRFLNDLDNNLKPKVDKYGVTTVSVYRAGVAESPKERGVERESYLRCDEFAPKDGRAANRSQAIFAAPTLGAAAQWVHGISHIRNILDYRVREIRVDPDSTYVYSIRKWEAASGDMDWNDKSGNSERTNQQMKDYWDSGILLREWLHRAKSDPDLDPMEWELLLQPEDLKKVSNVSAEKTADNGLYGPDEYVRKTLKDNSKALRQLKQ